MGSAEILLDCGATSHMFCDCSLFIHYISSPNSETISIGDGYTIPIAGMSSVQWKSCLPGGSHTVTLYAVQHILLLTANLVSLETLQRERSHSPVSKRVLSSNIVGKSSFVASLQDSQACCTTSTATFLGGRVRVKVSLCLLLGPVRAFAFDIADLATSI